MQNNLDGEESNQRRILYLNSKCVYTFNNSYTHSNLKVLYTITHLGTGSNPCLNPFLGQDKKSHLRFQI